MKMIKTSVVVSLSLLAGLLTISLAEAGHGGGMAAWADTVLAAILVSAVMCTVAAFPGLETGTEAIGMVATMPVSRVAAMLLAIMVEHATLMLTGTTGMV